MVAAHQTETFPIWAAELTTPSMVRIAISNRLGFTCNLISRERAGSEDLRVTYCRMLPHQYHLRHHHPHASEFYFVIRGECTVYVGGETVRATSGTSIYVPRNTVHAVRNDGEGVCEFLAGFNRPEHAECGIVHDE
jgi:quercetin dioxygenase-like cupin family protein